jgi:hypothetical protein
MAEPMNIWLTALDRRLGVNPMISRLFQIPEFQQRDPIDAVFLSFIAAPQNFELDHAALSKLKGIKKPIIVFDHTEGLWQNFILGQTDGANAPHEYYELHETLKFMDVRAYFKRELFNGWFHDPCNCKCQIYPLDWVLSGAVFPPVDSREQFEKRPIDILMSWGYSSEDRPRLMGELLKQAGRFGAHFCLTEEDLDRALAEKRERIFALLHTPHYRRIHFSKLFQWQQQAKVSISLKGAGYKCFRDCEAPHNSIMARQEPNAVVWSYPWINRDNCLGLPINQDFSLSVGAAVDYLFHSLRIEQGALYNIYLRGMENNLKYHAAEYSRNYLLPKIQEALK